MAANVVVTINACSAEHVVKIGPDSVLYPKLLENMFPLSTPSAGMDGVFWRFKGWACFVTLPKYCYFFC